MRWLASSAVFALVILQSNITSAETLATRSSSFQFMKEYIREVGELEELRAKAESDLKANPKDFAACIRNSETWEMTLRTDAMMMRQTHLSVGKDVNTVPALIAGFYEQKRRSLAEFSKLCSVMYGGPQENVDYAKLAADLPKHTARIQYVDKTLFQMIRLIFATIWSNRVDGHGHVSYLMIDGRQRDDLLHEIENWFPAKDDKLDDSYPRSAMRILRLKLKEFKSSDGR